MLGLDFYEPSVRRAWIRQLLGPLDDYSWNERAKELFNWQFANVPAYRKLCLAHGVTPKQLKDWRKIPAVPQQLFKLEKLFAYGSRRPGATYETSGTTTGQPGRQFLRQTDIYRAAAIEGARRAGLFDRKPELHFLTPAPTKAPHSSLSAMFGFWQKTSGQSGRRFWATPQGFDFMELREALQTSIKARTIIGLCGTAFSFVHLLDVWAGLPPLRFPLGSWLLETGGFKGRSREIPKAKLYAQMSRLFSIPDQSIWNEYGMSELSSQAYAHGTNGLNFTPPWARVLVWNPVTHREVSVGQRGLVRWMDLANTDSVLAVQTLDLAIRTIKGFRLIGRLPRTEARGCSLSAEDIADKNKRGEL